VATKRGHIPKPFQRESISLDRHGKEWKHVRADLVKSGDIVEGIGQIYSSERVGASAVRLTGYSGRRTFTAGEILKVFTRG
jgi:hypothetical protein